MNILLVIVFYFLIFAVSMHILHWYGWLLYCFLIYSFIYKYIRTMYAEIFVELDNKTSAL